MRIWCRWGSGNILNPPSGYLPSALAIRSFMTDIKTMKEMISQEKFWEIRIGIHTGSVIAGVVGNK